MPASISLADVSFRWPDGTPVVIVDAVFGSVRTGLIGANGSGKSTLLRLTSGELIPEQGSVSVTGSVSCLPQSLPLRPHLRVDEVLGIRSARHALRVVGSGSVDVAHFDAVGPDWGVEERAASPTAQASGSDPASSSDRI